MEGQLESYSEIYNRLVSTPYEEMIDDPMLSTVLKTGEYFWTDKSHYEVNDGDYVALFNKCVIYGRIEYIDTLLKLIDERGLGGLSSFNAIKYCYARVRTPVYSNILVKLLVHEKNPIEAILGKYTLLTKFLGIVLSADVSFSKYVLEVLLESDLWHARVMGAILMEQPTKEFFRMITSNMDVLVSYFKDTSGKASAFTNLYKGDLIEGKILNFHKKFMKHVFTTVIILSWSEYLLNATGRSVEFREFAEKQPIPNKPSIDIAVILSTIRDDMKLPSTVVAGKKANGRIPRVRVPQSIPIDHNDGPIFEAAMSFIRGPREDTKDFDIDRSVLQGNRIELRLISPLGNRSIFLNDYTTRAIYEDSPTQVFIKGSLPYENKTKSIAEYSRDFVPTPIDQIRVIEWASKNDADM